MKKILKVFFIMITLFIFLTGCSKKDNESLLTAINLEELLDLMENKETFLFTTFNDKDKNNSNFKKVIENYQNNTKNNIYFLNYDSLTFFESEYLNTLTDNQEYAIALYYVSEGQIINSILNPSTTVEILENIGDVNSKKLDLTKYYEIRNSRYNNGLEELQKGFISSAYGSFYQSLPKEEANEILKKENIFNLINSWKSSGKTKNKCEYLNLNISANENKLYKNYYNGKCDSFTEEKYQVTVYEYYIDNNTIMGKTTKADEYQKLYEIEELTDNILKIKTKNKSYILEKMN